MKTRKTTSEPLPARDGSVMSDRHILNWIAGQLNTRKGAQLRLTIQDNRDMGYKKNRITLFGGVGSQDITGKGDTVRKALTAMIRAHSQNDKAEAPSLSEVDPPAAGCASSIVQKPVK